MFSVQSVTFVRHSELLHPRSLFHSSDMEVRLASRDNEVVRVTGINEYGFLRVRTQNGAELMLQPDGNSFDIMRNLIVMKKK